MNSEEVSGARPSDQALVNEAPAGLRPTGFDPSREGLRALSALNASIKERKAVTAFLMTLAARATYRFHHELPWWALLSRRQTRWTAATLVGLVRSLEDGEHHEDQARWLSDIGGGYLRIVPSDSDGPRMDETPAEAARGEAGPARAAEGGIAQGVDP